eukprot:Gregarina_sp_Pseudo_9__3170@NODE_335_length_3126_cov_16_342404_g315_i0_p5_GENE_NODE_335_length_3126_cov_16_342404_g315_i0NODE_335_length_3126_cov_16_342404_g315_i0_p5_ORF_typecomplete_len109_score9_46FAM167/PF11652_8/0_18FAM167/PF11652_8/2_5e03_NODE_335_length_3126_cov_16_342404_g315_i014571783
MLDAIEDTTLARQIARIRNQARALKTSPQCTRRDFPSSFRSQLLAGLTISHQTPNSAALLQTGPILQTPHNIYLPPIFSNSIIDTYQNMLDKSRSEQLTHLELTLIME